MERDADTAQWYGWHWLCTGRAVLCYIAMQKHNEFSRVKTPRSCYPLLSPLCGGKGTCGIHAACGAACAGRIHAACGATCAGRVHAACGTARAGRIHTACGTARAGRIHAACGAARAGRVHAACGTARAGRIHAACGAACAGRVHAAYRCTACRQFPHHARDGPSRDRRSQKVDTHRRHCLSCDYCRCAWRCSARRQGQ